MKMKISQGEQEQKKVDAPTEEAPAVEDAPAVEEAPPAEEAEKKKED